MNYEILMNEAAAAGLTVKEKRLRYNDGRIKGNRIAIRKDIQTNIEKSCVLAEELGHYHTTTGDILDQASATNRKQEHRARAWSYDRMIGLTGIVSCYRSGCLSAYEMAEHLNVTEDFLKEALLHYRAKYGTCATLDNYVIYFEPTLGVFELR